MRIDALVKVGPATIVAIADFGARTVVTGINAMLYRLCHCRRRRLRWVRTAR
jgi:hypothetical protein